MNNYCKEISDSLVKLGNGSEPITVKYLEKLMDWTKDKNVPTNIVKTQEQADQMNEQERLISEEFGTIPHKWGIGMVYYLVMSRSKVFIEFVSKHQNVFIMKDQYMV